MEIKDVAGLSEPMTKLIEVVAQGIGGWVKPWQIKRTADAKAYEIETIAHALRKNSNTLNLLEYDDEKVKLLCEQSGVAPEAAQELIALNERAVSRLTHRELRRQANVENAVHYAMDELFQEENVSAESVDEDWIARFFNIVEDVSNEQMQQLWGRILAGEIKRPKSYSLRTLEVLRNISPEEAAAFQRICRYIVTIDGERFIIDKSVCLYKPDDIGDLNLVTDIGLISIVTTNMAPGNQVINIGNKIIYFKVTRGLVRLLRFTPVGGETLKLVDCKAKDEDIDLILKTCLNRLGRVH
ncbi:MAG: DUF2806 domain-containing protein [Candidatus Electronema sp. VV]